MNQSAAVADLEYQRARVVLRAEAYEWRTPDFGHFEVGAAWSEVRTGFGAGRGIAARGELMTHGQLTSSRGASGR